MAEDSGFEKICVVGHGSDDQNPVGILTDKFFYNFSLHICGAVGKRGIGVIAVSVQKGRNSFKNIGMVCLCNIGEHNTDIFCCMLFQIPRRGIRDIFQLFHGIENFHPCLRADVAAAAQTAGHGGYGNARVPCHIF